MGLTQNDIEMLRERVPEQFRADPARTLNPTFRDADNLTDDGGYGASLRAERDEIADAVAQPNRDIVAERIATETQIQREIADGTGSITNIAVQAQKSGGLHSLTEAQKKEKKGGIDITTQLILLNQQIEALQRQIDFYENENERLQEEINEIDQLAADIKAGRVAPDDPRLDEYGITPHDLANGGISALEKLDEQRKTREQEIAENQAKIDDAKQEQAGLETEAKELHANAKAVAEQTLGENIMKAGEERRSATLSDEQKSEIEDSIRGARTAADKTEGLEQRKLTLEDLDQFKGTDEYTAKIDKFIASADPHTLLKILTDPERNPEVEVRIQLKNFKSDLSQLDQFKGSEDYEMYVQMAVDDAPEAVREALRKEPDLDEAIVAALYEPYSDTIDKPDKSSQPPSEPSSISEHSDIAQASPERDLRTQTPSLG